ncbi:LPS biosynthesis protein [Spirochaetia bacterium]|nr:LPS biosynthesis protein [Spirochaetia bacterium]
MDEETKDDEINLIDLFAVLWQRKTMIITITLIALIGVVIFAVISFKLSTETSPLPNKYTPEALMLINNQNSQSSSLSSILSNSGGLGSLAGLMGLSVGSSANSQLAVFLTGSNSMLDAVVDKFDLITRYKIDTPKAKAKSPRADSRKTLKKKLTAETDEKSGVFSISFTDTDPVFAREVVNFCVAYLERRFDEMGIDKNKIEKDNLEVNIENTFKEIQRLELESRQLERSVGMGNISGNTPAISLELNRLELELSAQKQIYTQLKIQYELLKVTMASESPVFQVLEYAEVPDRKSGPSRGMICIIVTFAAGFFSVFLAFILNAIENIKKDPEAMAKLRNLPPKRQAGVPRRMDKE